MIRDFDFCVNTEFIFGREAHRRAGDKLKQLGIKRLLIHHDGGPYLYDTGLLKDIKEDMERCGIQVWELSADHREITVCLFGSNLAMAGYTRIESYFKRPDRAGKNRWY